MYKKWLYWLLLCLTGIYFLLSALEISTRYIKNTFDDEYDSYIQPDNSIIHHAVVSIPQIDLLPVLLPFMLALCVLQLHESTEEQPVNAPPGLLVKPPDLVLLSHSFRI